MASAVPLVLQSVPSSDSILPISLDLLRPGGITTLLSRLEGGGIDLLVNFAGKGLPARVEFFDFEQQREIIRLNFEVPVELTYALPPLLKVRGGAVLKIASVAGYLPAPNLAVFAA